MPPLRLLGACASARLALCWLGRGAAPSSALRQHTRSVQPTVSHILGRFSLSTSSNSSSSNNTVGTLFVSSKDEVVKALDVWNDGILNSNCFIGTVQYFDPSEVVEQLDHADAASERGSQAQAKSMPAEHEDKPSAGSTRDAELGWHLGDDGPGGKEVEDFYDKFEEITNLANNGTGMSDCDMMVALKTCLHS